MDWLKELGRRIGMLLHRRQFRADLEQEILSLGELARMEQTRSRRSSSAAGQR